MHILRRTGKLSQRGTITMCSHNWGVKTLQLLLLKVYPRFTCIETACVAHNEQKQKECHYKLRVVMRIMIPAVVGVAGAHSVRLCPRGDAELATAFWQTMPQGLPPQMLVRAPWPSPSPFLAEMLRLQCLQADHPPRRLHSHAIDQNLCPTLDYWYTFRVIIISRC